MAKKKSHEIVIPTEDRRHIGVIRNGKISGEIFCHDDKRREELGLRPIPKPDLSDFVEELRS